MLGVYCNKIKRQTALFWQAAVLKGSVWLYFLWPLSVIFALIVRLRKACYKLGILQSNSVNVPVWVVGNLSVGGGGKTPLVRAITKLAAAEKRSVGILLRGYGAKTFDFPHEVTENDTAISVGDEALLHFNFLKRQRLTSSTVVIDPNRYRGADYLANKGVDLIILDDGLQHYALKKDKALCVIKPVICAQGFYQYLLPFGAMREPKSRLKEMDIVIQAGMPSSVKGHGYQLTTNSLEPVGTKSPGKTLQFGSGVHLIAGIAHPADFIASVQLSGYRVLSMTALGDHETLDTLPEHRPLLMTEKDAVKYQHLVLDDVWYLPVDAVLSEQTKNTINDWLRAI